MVLKKELFNNLKNDTYCRIMRSKVAGVGVVAIRDIPKNIYPFVFSGKKICGANRTTYNLTKDEINKLPIEVQKMIKDFFSEEDDGSYYVVKDGLNSLDVSSYMNHSDKPNVGVVEIKKCNFYIFKTLKKIKEGDELFINYNNFY